VAVLYLFTIPLFLYNNVYKRVGNFQVFHRIFWRGFLAERFPLFFSRWTSKKERKRHFSVLAQKDDLSITNFFSFDSSFRQNRYLFFELKDWELLKPLEDFERDYREFIFKLRIKRKKVRQRVASLIAVFRSIPPGLFRFLFNGTLVNFFSRMLFFPARLWDFATPFLSLVLYVIYLCFAYPFYFLVYTYNKLLNYKEVFVINISRFDTYRIFALLRFSLLFSISLLLLLEFFYFFGWHILFVQNVAMKWLDPFIYNWLFFILLTHLLLSFFSSYFTDIWSEAKYYLLTYPFVVQSWLIWWMMKHELSKKYLAYGNLIKTTKHSFLVDDYLKPFLLLFYTTMNPISSATKSVFKRPYEAYDVEASQFLFDYVTSLFT
jgi:hypothetical protein